MRHLQRRHLCLFLCCTIISINCVSQEAVFWPKPTASRQQEPAYREKGKSKYSKTRKFKQKKRVPIEYRTSDRTIVQTAQGNQAHVDYYYSKRDNTPYVNLQKGMIYNRQRSPERRHKPRKQ